MNSSDVGPTIIGLTWAVAIYPARPTDNETGRAAHVRFAAHCGLKSDIAACPGCADFVAEVGDDDEEGSARGF